MITGNRATVKHPRGVIQQIQHNADWGILARTCPRIKFLRVFRPISTPNGIFGVDEDCVARCVPAKDCGDRKMSCRVNLSNNAREGTTGFRFSVFSFRRKQRNGGKLVSEHRKPQTIPRPTSTVHRPLSTVPRPPSTVHRPLSTVHPPPPPAPLHPAPRCPCSLSPHAMQHNATKCHTLTRFRLPGYWQRDIDA